MRMKKERSMIWRRRGDSVLRQTHRLITEALRRGSLGEGSMAWQSRSVLAVSSTCYVCQSEFLSSDVPAINVVRQGLCRRVMFFRLGSQLETLR